MPNALVTSRKTPVTSGPSSNAERISCAIDGNWFVPESPGLNLEIPLAILAGFLKKMRTC